MFWLLENDGHNTPTWHKFRDQEQAEGYLSERAGEPVDLDEGEFSDGDATLWTPFDKPELYTADHTAE